MNPKENRINKTIDFVSKSLGKEASVLDLGIPNELSDRLKEKGYKIENTSGQDLDIDQTVLKKDFDAVTAFEILEHTVNPFEILTAIKATHLFASIPLRLWFAKAYRSKTDPWDRHFHEFEDWQFDWLLEKTGWKIVRSEKWKSPTKKIGFRPLLRWITNRYYIVEAKRISKTD